MPAGSSPVVGSSSSSSRGCAQQRRGDPEPLAHAVRVAADAVLRAVAQLDELEHLVDPGARARLVVVGEQLQVAPAGEVRVEARAFDEAGDAVERLRAVDERVAAEQPRRALGRADQAEQHPQRRRLAGAVRAEVAEHVAALDRQVDVVDRDDLAVALDQARAPRPAARRSLHRPRGRLGRRGRQRACEDVGRCRSTATRAPCRAASRARAPSGRRARRSAGPPARPPGDAASALRSTSAIAAESLAVERRARCRRRRAARRGAAGRRACRVRPTGKSAAACTAARPVTAGVLAPLVALATGAPRSTTFAPAGGATSTSLRATAP